MNRVNIKEASKILESLDFVVIYTHAHPDGDALGSSFALCEILKKMGKRVKVVCLDTLPAYLQFIWDVKGDDFEAQNIVTCDVADMTLLGDYKENKKIVLAIDHHKQNRVDCENLLCIPEMAATGEIIFELAREMNISLDTYIAECLYTAISTDTGCFKFSNTTAHTFFAVSELCRYAPEGNFGYLNTPLFITKSVNKMKFENEIISNMKFYFEGKVSVAVVDTELLKKHSVSDSETGGVEQLGKTLEGVELAITLKEREDGYKVSMRSSDSIDCSEICGHFSGGGHHSAAGCFFKKSADETVTEILSYIEEKGIL
ncbi:MAG: bifunctional oligoribonuclease/PAP phosphatase NrnA [Ruminococcaceae bacterium]|nr:bifunctional oligoribonuclease/PAP phosphatase NrnA [Oscillospiraceae bacterium]